MAIKLGFNRIKELARQKAERVKSAGDGAAKQEFYSSDGTNPLSYLMLKAIDLLRLREPNVDARFHPGSPKLWYQKALDVVSSTGATPALYTGTLRHKGNIAVASSGANKTAKTAYGIKTAWA